MATRARTPRPEIDRQRLRDEFVAIQGTPPETATLLVERIAAADDDIWDAAMTWMSSAQMPTAPEIHGYTPASLAERLRPSQVFTALAGLRTDPRVALDALRYSPDDLPGAGRRFEQQVAEVLERAGFRFERSSPDGPPLFILRGTRGAVLVEAKATSDSARLRDALHFLTRAIDELGIEHGLLVVPSPGEAGVHLADDRVQIVSLAQLGEVIARDA
jgi:hypothetical protein